VVVSGGAEWIRGTCDEIFGGRKITFVPGLFHCLEYAAAVRAIHLDGEERERRFGPRLKPSGARRSQRGANAMPALKGRVMNLRLPDLLEWRANQALAT